MTLEIALWAVLPYVACVTFILGHFWRYRIDRFGWSDEWMQLFRPRKARWGIVLFHAGTFAVIGGHVLGLLVPVAVVSSGGISDAAYRVVAVTLGGFFGLLVLAGLGGLVWRRTMVRTIVANTRWIDRLTLALLFLVVTLGMAETLGVNLFGGGFDYRSTVGVWFRSVLLLSPDTRIMERAPLLYQAHALAAWSVVIVWPFSKLVHVWYVPFYARKSLVVYRTRMSAGSSKM